MPSRRSHTKSHHGCRQCKARRVKCDETSPQCQRCVKRHIVCSFLEDTADAFPTPPSTVALVDHTTPTNGRSTPEPGGQRAEVVQPHQPDVLPCTPSSSLGPLGPSFNLRDIELIHHYCTRTYLTLNSRITTHVIFRDTFFQEGLRHEFLLHAIMGTSALHKAVMLPRSSDRFEEYAKVALTHQNAALAGYIPAVSIPSEENGIALFSLSLLLTLWAFATKDLPENLKKAGMALTSLSRDPEVLLPVGSPTLQFVEIIMILRGIYSVMKETDQWLQGDIEELLRYPRVEELPIHPPEVENAFYILDRELREFHSEEAEAKELCIQQISRLRQISRCSATLLTPPPLPVFADSAPFEPKANDKTSLNMKRCRHGHKKRCRQVRASPGKLYLCRREWQTLHRPYQSRSLPSLAASTSPLLVTKSDGTLSSGKLGSAHQRPRRWTLSSKAACTRRRAATAISAIYKPASTGPLDTTDLPSPAMIVLRRASMARASPPKRMSLTVFPEPRFERSRRRVLSSFLRAITGAADEDKESPWPRADAEGPSPESLGAYGAQLSRRGRVRTVCTKVTDVQPMMVSPTGTPVDGETASRRCSTKYITGDQVLEVIWDANVSPQTSPSSSGTESVGDNRSKRRRSLAMESLENQLKKADAQSRRQSQTTNEQARKSSYNAEDERQRQSSLHSALGFRLSRFANEAALQNLPHSRAFRGREGTDLSAAGPGNYPTPDSPAVYLEPEGTIEFFPPLASPRGTEVGPFTAVESATARGFQHRPSPLMSTPLVEALGMGGMTACIIPSLVHCQHLRGAGSGFSTSIIAHHACVMTAIPPAEPRPPSLPGAAPPIFSSESSRPFPPTPRPVSLSVVQKQGEEDSFTPNDGRHSTDDRPAKRRRLSIDNGQAPRGAAAGDLVVKTTLVDDYRFLSTLVRERVTEEDGPTSADYPPLPPRPWRLAPTKKREEDATPTHRARSPVPVPTTPDTGYSSEGVPRFSNQRPIGYFAWTGRQLEDNLSAENVKTGYFDRPPNPAEKETNTARVSVYNALKHHQGIETLSTLFSMVLEAKNKFCLITSASTFKPPPRVTLAEAKRRSWIGDLANTNVPLRKLSRTIPQGIRGQGLLDQCIQNKVPLSRAIWFAKCVGANEIRTLKRKGTTPQAAVGTEAKWIREWTVNVEQFVEKIVDQAGQPSWRPDIQYGLRLATRLYLENLLDRDHYLDWALKSFTLSKDEQLPSWLLVVQIYKQDMVKFRKRGRMLAEALLNKCTRMRDRPSAMAQSLTKRLKDTIRAVAVFHCNCFLMPDQWLAVREALESCLDLNNPTERATMSYLDSVNERCMGANRHLYLAKMSQEDKVVSILDRAKAPYDLASLSNALLEACPNTHKLATYCLEWATTKFRCGSARIYLTSRLLRRWLRQGLDLDPAIIQFFGQAATSPDRRNSGSLEHIFFDLSRSHSFSASKWLQAMNVRGLPHQNSVHTRTIICASGTSLQQQWAEGATALLMDLSLSMSNGHIVNLRNAFLDRAGHNLALEMEVVQKIIGELQHALCDSSPPDRVEAVRQQSIKSLLTGWNWRVRNHISHWLRALVTETLKTKMSKKDQQSPSQSLEQKQFLLVRTALETLGDTPVLADVVGLFSSLNGGEQVQASLAETISRHADAFSAIGALEPLQDRLAQVYMSMRTVKSTVPLFATALFELCTDYPTRAIPAKLLQQDLVRGDRGRAMAACSPFSDGVAESLQQAETTFIDDFEAVLQSEPSMSEQAMSRLFALLTERIEKQQGTIVGEDALFSYCQLMARLRWCGRGQSDQLLKTWLVKALSKYASTFTRNLVLTLIATGCLTIDLLVEAVGLIGISTALAHHSWLVSPGAISEHPYAYVAATKWSAFSRRHPDETLNLLGYASQSDRDRFEMTACINLVQATSIDLTSLPKASRLSLEKNLATLLGINKTCELAFRSALSALDVFSSRFVQAQLRFFSSTSTPEEANAIATAIFEVVGDPQQPPSTTDQMSTILQAAEGEVAAQVRQIAEDRVVNTLPRIGWKGTEGLVLEPKLSASLSRVVDQAFQLCPPASRPSPKSSQRLVDLLSQILRYLKTPGSGTATLPKTPTTATSPSNTVLHAQASASGQINPTSSPGDGMASLSVGPVFEYLRIILQLLCLQRPSASIPVSALSAPAPPKQGPDAIRILAHLATIVTHHELTSALVDSDRDLAALAREVINFAYDVMATYVDEVSDEGRQLLAKILRDKLRDSHNARLKYLFGNVTTCGSEIPGGEELGKGLLLVKRDSDGAPKGKILGEWRPKIWEVLETGGRSDTDVSIGLGLFGARRI
ncbi:hypothetical protein DV735_g4566, partial [Chaetothyriales sp. CBS 134920]